MAQSEMYPNLRYSHGLLFVLIFSLATAMSGCGDNSGGWSIANLNALTTFTSTIPGAAGATWTISGNATAHDTNTLAVGNLSRRIKYADPRSVIADTTGAWQGTLTFYDLRAYQATPGSDGLQSVSGTVGVGTPDIFMRGATKVVKTNTTISFPP